MGRSARKREARHTSHGKRKRVCAESAPQPQRVPHTASLQEEEELAREDADVPGVLNLDTADDKPNAAGGHGASSDKGRIPNPFSDEDGTNDPDGASISSSHSKRTGSAGGSGVAESPVECRKDHDKGVKRNAEVAALSADDGVLPDGSNIHVTVVLECANLEAVKLPGARGGYGLLSSDEHGSLLRKMKRDPNDARPDITHQCLLTLLDSPLNKAGRLTVYVRTKRNVLFSVHPQTRIPRTIRRFSGLMVELLQRLKVRSTSGSEPLLQVVRNPITSHLPVGQRRMLCTYNCDNVVDVRSHARETVRSIQQEKARLFDKQSVARNSDVVQDDASTGDDEKGPIQVLYVVGAMAHGKVETDWTDEEICISEYPLSAATVCSRIVFTYECLMGIL